MFHILKKKVEEEIKYYVFPAFRINKVAII